MTLQEAREFKKQFKKPENEVPWEEFDMDEEKVGCAIGLLLNELGRIESKYYSGRANSILSVKRCYLHHVKRWHDIKLYIMKEFKTFATHIPADDNYTTKLIGYCTEGIVLLSKETNKTPSSVESNIMIALGLEN